MSKLNNFWQCPFYKLVFKNGQAVIAHAANKTPSDENELAEWRKGTRARMTSLERYYVDVLYRVINFNHVLDRLKQARYLHTKSPGSFLCRDSAISRNDWVDYHFYVYTTSLASFLDCTLLLTAEVYQLGLSPRHCTFEIITQHEWLAGSKTLKSLRALKKTLDKHIQRRHRYLHRGEESSFCDHTDPENLWQLRAITFLAGQNHHLISPQMLSQLWKKQLEEVRQKIDTLEEDVLLKTSDVLACLLPIYEHYADSYK